VTAGGRVSGTLVCGRPAYDGEHLVTLVVAQVGDVGRGQLVDPQAVVQE
jgi:hypothetical protein